MPSIKPRVLRSIRQSFAKSNTPNRRGAELAAQQLVDALTANPTGLIDGLGKAVSLSRKDAFKRRERLKKLAAKVRKLQTEVAREATDGRPESFRAVVRLQMALLDIEEHMPFTACPDCYVGRWQACPTCSNQGWVSRAQWKEISGRRANYRSADRGEVQRDRRAAGGGEAGGAGWGTARLGGEAVGGIRLGPTEQPDTPTILHGDHGFGEPCGLEDQKQKPSAADEHCGIGSGDARDCG
jgi:hypothetical protein